MLIDHIASNGNSAANAHAYITATAANTNANSVSGTGNTFACVKIDINLGSFAFYKTALLQKTVRNLLNTIIIQLV